MSKPKFNKRIATLGTKKDKLDNEIIIRHCDTLGFSPVFTFFLRNYADLIDNGLGDPVTLWNDNFCSVLYCVDNNEKILGSIVYEIVEHHKQLYIILSSVSEECRGRGIFHILHQFLENIAKERKCSGITSHVHKNNNIRLITAEKEGMYPQPYYFMWKQL